VRVLASLEELQSATLNVQRSGYRRHTRTENIRVIATCHPQRKYRLQETCVNTQASTQCVGRRQISIAETPKSPKCQRYLVPDTSPWDSGGVARNRVACRHHEIRTIKKKIGDLQAQSLASALFNTDSITWHTCRDRCVNPSTCRDRYQQR
jgi:hypothetical protein